MNFFKNIKNKYLRQGNNFSGQIFPILLICIAALLLAVVVTKKTGSNSITQTCASNAADAGSLATASRQASAFNELAVKNKEMNEYYLTNLGYYTSLHNYAQLLLGTASTSCENLQKSIEEALGHMSHSYPGCVCPGGCYPAWFQLDGAGDNEYAIGLALGVAEKIIAFKVIVSYMKVITDNFKDNQIGNYCNARASMAQAYPQSKSIGISYAFSNSCTSSKAAKSDDFDYWLRTEKFKGSAFSEETTSIATYEWQTGPTEDCGVGWCGTKVTLDLPKIVSYEVKHTLWNYPEKKNLEIAKELGCIPLELGAIDVEKDPFDIAAAERLITDMVAFANYVSINAWYGRTIFEPTRGAHCVRHTSCGGKPVRCHSYWVCEGGCSYNFGLAAELITRQNCILRAVKALNLGQPGILSPKALKARSQATFENVWKTADAQNFTNNVSADVKCEAVVNQKDKWGNPGLMIININAEPKFIGPPADWKTRCNVFIFCRTEKCNPAGEGVTRTCTSEFHGQGDLATFKDNYEAKIAEVH